MKNLSQYTYIFLVVLFVFSCANRGTPSGGPMDEIPPVIIKSEPENFSTNFKAKEIKISFDEFIKIKNLQRNLIISPPMDPEPEITPLGSASRFITITINDTLTANTTYAFNFGESIVDNNEENPYPFYRYVFSTGDYIDSLSVSGYITDASLRKPDEFVTVMLYEVDSTYSDSVIYKQKPKYITSTLDTISTFTISNIKEGKYLMVAIKDENSNYQYEQKSDKIGFVKNHITLPNDSIYNIKLFKEQLDFKATRPALLSGQKLAFGYEGTHDEMKVKLLSEKPNNFAQTFTKDPERDTIFYWYKPKLEVDSLVFEIENEDYRDTLVARIRDIEKDSLTFKPLQTRFLLFTEDFQLQSNIPIDKFDQSKVSLVDKDTVAVDFDVTYDHFNSTYTFEILKTENNTYTFQMLPETFTDFFGKTNDTLNYLIKTKEYSDYGNLRINLENATYPIILQLLTEQGDVEYEQIVREDKPVDFRFLPPGNYYIRAIFDANDNGKYDSGNYLLKQQPERISYMKDFYEARAFYDEILTFTLED